MPTYWLYLLDSRGARIEPGSNYGLDNDQQAVILIDWFTADGVRVGIWRESEDGGRQPILPASAARWRASIRSRTVNSPS